MKNIEISEIIGNINEKYIDEAILYTGKENKIHHNRLLKWRTTAACLCMVIVGAFAISKVNPSVSEDLTGYYPDTDKLLESALPDSEANDTEIPGQILTDKDEVDTSPVYYSSLMLADSILDEEALALSEAAVSSITSFDITSFDELQDHCCMIIEGTVTDLYVKHYTYDIYSDKFEENGILHGKTDTIVYEVAVDKTWYGKDISGDTILIEDTSYFTEPILAVKEGRRYVLPLYEDGETIGVHEYAGGDIARETVYSTIYPYHPQIEVTKDGSYVVSEDWTTLVANNAKKVIMDTLADDDFWKDKMYLVDEKVFEEQMAVLISDIK